MQTHYLFVLAALPFMVFAADIHPEVERALNWRVPQNTCIEPDDPGTGLDVVDASGTVNRLDVDTYELERYERQKKRWQGCLQDYKSSLLKEFERMKNSAQYGLTQEQAHKILSNMATIQKVIESPNGLLSED